MLELLQFRHSPYNEKARWALDLKRVPHRRRSLLPGPHMGVVKRITGRTETPVLVHEVGAIDQSARIVQWLDAKYPNPALLPADQQQRDEALRIQRWFDDDLTPRMRRTVLQTLLQEPGMFARIFADGAPAWQRIAYACIVPLAAPLVRKGNGITGDAAVQDGHAAAAQAFDFVAQRSSATGYLCGSTFSIADLTAASTLAVFVKPDNSPMACPAPVGPRFQTLLDRYTRHPGAAWVRAVYARHRGSQGDFDGPSERTT
jgi:glutathione S-transferase